jgi:hypothetical protein
MISSNKHFDRRATAQRMSELINNLSIDEQRILARLLNNWEKRDQRTHPRTTCSIITEYVALNRVYKDSIKNISLGGAYIESEHGFPVNLEIDQRFFFPNFEIPIQSKSKIMWSGPGGFGVQFAIKENKK